MNETGSARSLADLLAGDVVFFDTEATGGKPGDRLVELAAIRYEGGRERERFVRLVDPGMPVPPRAVAIHGMSESELRGQAIAGEVIPEFLDFARGAALLAYHVRFDARLLSYEAAREGLRLPHQPCYDLRHAVKPILGPARPRHTDLASLVEALELPPARFHRALADTEALVRAAFALAGLRGDAETPMLQPQSLDLDWPMIPELPPRLAALRPQRRPRSVEIRYEGMRWTGWRAIVPSMIFASRRRALLRAYCLSSSLNKLYHLERVMDVRELESERE